MGLREIQFKQAYHKPEDDIAAAFYLPSMAAAVRYDRAVGYFGSAVLALAWPSLRQFVRNGGKMRLICSPVLADVDSEALYEGYSARSEARQSEFVAAEFRRLLTTPGTLKPARVLAALVALDVIEFKIAWVSPKASARSRRLFHDKLGLFTDSNEDIIAFKGSMNETWAGLSLDGNLESVDVFLGWADERERQRVLDEIDYFRRLWAGEFPGVDVRSLPEVAREEIISAADVDNWEDLVDSILIEIEGGERWKPDAEHLDGRTPRPHQAAALKAWEERGRRGILKHATGSGKTFTALCAIGDALRRGETPLVLVPSELLLEQWRDELRTLFSANGARLLVCGGGNSEWQRSGLLRQWTRASGTESARLVLATIQTASSDAFLNLVSGGPHLFVVADEVHRLGAKQAQGVLDLESGPRLGLSATPERAGDAAGTQAIFDYFEGIVPPPFTLMDAIASGALTPYSYDVSRVRLTEAEQGDWTASTAKIRRLYAQTRTSEDERLQDRLKMELIRRARIVKKASRKVEAAADVLEAHYRPGSRWIVYCDDQVQLDAVLQRLRGRFGAGVYEYHSQMPGDRRRTLALFERAGGIVVSIRCLDEGVDIPAVDSALILASSRNPREYVQRRGRVLRRADGKSVARIHDVLVTPAVDPDEPPETSIVEGEIVRAVEFGRSALNPSCIADLEHLAIEFGIDFDRYRDAGLEDDEPGDAHE